MEDNVIEVDFTEEEKAIAEGDLKDTPVKEEELTAMTQEEFEEVLMETGILMPASDVHHYMVRNASYMKLIESEEFKASGISLEEVLSDDYITEQQKMASTNLGIMRYVTEQVIAKMQEHHEEDPQIKEAIETAKEMMND